MLQARLAVECHAAQHGILRNQIANTIEDKGLTSDREGRTAISAALIAVVGMFRIALFAVLAILESVVRLVLVFVSLAGFGACALYAFLAPPHLHFPQTLMLVISSAAAILLAFYYWMLRTMRP